MEEAMRGGAEVVYQAVLLDPSGWRGIADFVERLLDGSYEVADTKLARTSKPTHVLQLAFYSEQVADPGAVARPDAHRARVGRADL